MTNTTLQTSITTVVTKIPYMLVNKMIAGVLFAVVLLSGCNITNQTNNAAVSTSLSVSERMNTQCIEQVYAQKAAQNQSDLSHFLALANTAQYCVGDIQYSPQHPDIETAMQFSALVVVNFVKAGDIKSASAGLNEFRARFPQQDLLFDDYTSFVDTATVLVKQQEITPYQLTYLNINPTLRAEITRQRKWSLN